MGGIKLLMILSVLYLTGCTATTVRTATMAAPVKSGETVTTTKSETEIRLAEDSQ